MAKKATFYSVPDLRKQLRQLPKEANAKLRDASVDIAARIAEEAADAARSVGGVAALVAPSITASRDRVPVVKMGSSASLPSTERARTGPRQTIGDVIWGAEFGGGARPTTRQFHPWRGNDEGAGYFLFPTVKREHDFIQDRYSDALMDALEDIKPSGRR